MTSRGVNVNAHSQNRQIAKNSKYVPNCFCSEELRKALVEVQKTIPEEFPLRLNPPVTALLSGLFKSETIALDKCSSLERGVTRLF